MGLLLWVQVVGEAEKQDGTVNVRTRDELVRCFAVHHLTCVESPMTMHSRRRSNALADTTCVLVQRHGMHRLDDVVRNLKAERDTRSQRSLYGEESSVGKGVNKGAAGKGSKQQQKQQQPQQKTAQAQARQLPQQQQKPASNGNANGGPASDVDAAVAQSLAENLAL